MTQAEITDIITQSTISLLIIVVAALIITGIVTIGLLVEWRLFPSTKPFGRQESPEAADNKEYDVTPYEDTDEDNVIFNR